MKQKGMPGWMKKNPSEAFSQAYHKFAGTDGIWRTTLITTIVTSVLCYFYEMIYGLGCPDTLNEGVHYYRNADYSTSQARWMLRFINEAAGKNVIIPVITVLGYCLMIGLSAYIILRMLHIEKKLPAILLTALMVSFPIILHHFAFLYMALAYSFSFLMVILGVWFIRKRKVYGYILGTLCFLFMLGSYQAYIGAVSAFALIMLVYDSLHEKSMKKYLSDFGFTAAAGVVACLVNQPFSKLMMFIFHTGADGRVSDFSVKEIFKNIGFSLKYSYVWFFSYFKSDVLARKYLYTGIFVVIAILFILVLIKKIKEKSIAGTITFVLATLLLPIGMNFLLILMPSNGMRDILRYQYVLLFALLFILLEYAKEQIIGNICSYLSVLLIVGLLWGYVISANCTAMMYKLSYDHAIQQAMQMMEEIYDMDGYVKNQTHIVMGGCFPYDTVKDRYPKIFRFAEQEGGPVFWDNMYGMTMCRYHFFWDFLGVDAGYISDGEYLAAVQSQEYEEMPCWPEEGSIKMIGDDVVIKLWEGPPLW